MNGCRTLLLIAACAALSACTAGLLDSNAPPESVWWLEPTTLQADEATRGRSLVLDLTVVPGLDTDRMLNLDDAARLNHYAGAHWPDHLPELLGSLAERSLETAGWDDVRTGDYAREGECLLRLEARRFWGRLGSEQATRAVEVSLDGRFECAGEARTVSFGLAELVTEQRMGAIVAAFQRAMDQGMASLSTQITPP